MNTAELIQTALNIIDNHDWNWNMNDESYTSAKENAKAQRDHFVFIRNQIQDKEVKHMLNELWIATYEMTRPFISSLEMESHRVDAKKNREELLNIMYNKIAI